MKKLSELSSSEIVARVKLHEKKIKQLKEEAWRRAEKREWFK
jgi:hypothetical protein